MDFERKFEFFKNLYKIISGPLWIINTQYGGHDQEIRSFTKKLQLAIKTDQNIVFLAHKAQISNQLHIMVMYISFYGF
jgi:hypothetical protein